VVGGAGNLDSIKNGDLACFSERVAVGRRPPILPGAKSLTLTDRTVSSFHAQIKRLTDGFVIEDQNSTNGTLIDGRPVTNETPLPEGAVLFMGSQVLVFRTVTTPEIAAVNADLAAPFAPVATLSPRLATLCTKLRRLAPSPTELLLLGETGVGKEVFAHAIHAASGRAGPLLAINCAALPRELVESELFGYERGAHSTAKAKKPGLISLADGGTLFLDELAEMPIDVQSKLLRFLQDRTYMPIGGTRSETADVRIVAASSRVTETTGLPAIQEALLGRLGAHPIHLPPLRERIEDLGRLIAHFLGAVGCDRPIETEAFQALFLYRWPHNVRELQKVITEAELLSRGSPSIGFEHLPPFIVDAIVIETPEPPVSKTVAPADTRPWAGFAAPESYARPRRPVPGAEELRALLQQYQGNVARVAKHLDRQWAVIWRSLRRHGISANEYRVLDPATGEPLAPGDADASGAVPAGAGADDDDSNDEDDDDGDTLG
jgi:transcriptional regulator with PAS, ATPase and Fis domain